MPASVMHGFNHRHRFLRILGPTRIQYRNHRKIVVVDGKEAWIGGLNVGDEYMGRSQALRPLARHPCAHQGPRRARAPISASAKTGNGRRARSLRACPTSTEIAGDQSVLIMPTGPADKLESCAIAFDDVIGAVARAAVDRQPLFRAGRLDGNGALCGGDARRRCAHPHPGEARTTGSSGWRASPMPIA